MKDITRSLFFLTLSLFAVLAGSARADSVGFDSDRWEKRGQGTEHLGKPCFSGRAVLKDVAFTNGVIEVDVAFDGSRCFAGLLFRMASDGNFENFYLRPHNSNKPSALQYTPEFNGVAGWQLYNGDGFTAATTIPAEKWIHVRLEVFGTQARVFLDHAAEPALEIHDLKRGVSSGWIGVSGPPGGQAYFADFSYEIREDLAFPPPPEPDPPSGLITAWELSQPLCYVDVDLDHHPKDQGLGEITWTPVTPEHSGLVNIARTTPLKDGQPSVVFARTTLEQDAESPREINFGYSDAVVIFVNGMRLFTGVSSYRSRDATFLGVAGLFDTLVLPLKKGKNELLFAVVETFGGWGFVCQDADFVFQDKALSRRWETKKGMNMPESAAYDPARKVLYVSQFGSFSPPGSQFLSRVDLDGTIKQEHWVDGLVRPSGAIVFKNALYVVERHNLVEIDLESGTISKRHPFPEPRFPNDVAVDENGRAYISDSARNVIYRLADGKMEVWLEGDAVSSPNGVWVCGDALIWGNNGDNDLKSAHLETKDITTLAHVGPGGMDGIASDKDGNILVSQFTGRLFRVSPNGDVTMLLDTSAGGLDLCDFAWVPDQKLLVFPSIRANKLTAYRLD